MTSWNDYIKNKEKKKVQEPKEVFVKKKVVNKKFANYKQKYKEA